jgi:hypothetical protein
MYVVESNPHFLIELILAIVYPADPLSGVGWPDS